MAPPPFRQLLRREAAEIAPEEIFIDAANIPGFHPELYEGRMERSIARGAFGAFALTMVLGFAVLLWRLGDLQLRQGAAFAAAAQENRTYPILIRAPRGILYDRAFETLVENRPAFVISLRRDSFADDVAFRAALESVARVAGVSPGDIAAANDLLRAPPPERAAWPDEIFIASGDLRPAVLEIQARPADFPGAVITEASRRHYPLGALAGHVLGYVGRPSRDALARDPAVRSSDIVGTTGIELQYDALLRGRHGEKLLEVDAEGKTLRERFVIRPEPGNDLVLELDAGLQRFAAETLGRHLRAIGKRAGAVVALDPRDGAVRALVSHPAYDPNAFGETPDAPAIATLLQHPADPFFNRAISGGYPSASTVKPLLAVAALEEGTIDAQRTIYDPGYISVPNPYDPEQPTIFKDWKALGWVDMRRAIAQSANVYFYTIGGGYGDIRGLGIERIKRYLERFGWGASLGIDLPGEAHGLIPDPATKERLRPSDPVWRVGDTYITSIGQGDLQVTPLQLAVATAAIANGGTVFQPRLTKAVVDEDRTPRREFAPRTLRTNIARPESLAVAREGMRQAVTEGSAVALADLPVAVAGKTGTAQTGAYGRNHGWFTAFAPWRSPELVLTVIVEDGTGGTTDAVPIAKEILYHYFVHLARGAPPSTH